MKRASLSIDACRPWIRTGLATCMLAGSGLVQAATITVDTADDVIADDGECALREAVINTNNNDTSGSPDCPAGEALPDQDQIVFDPGLDGAPITLAIAGAGEDAAMTGDLDITEDLAITGNGPQRTIIDAGGIDRAINTFAITAIRELTIRGGSSPFGGGITAVDTNLVLIDSFVRDNEVTGGLPGFGAGGGGIGMIAGRLLLRRTTVMNNLARDAGGGVLMTDAPLGSTAEVFVADDARIVGNRLENSTGDAEGGGLYLSPSLNSVEFLRSEVSGNSATAAGGEALGGGVFLGDGPYELRNTTISGNRVTGSVRAAGGGLFFESTSGGGLVPDRFLHNVTIADNGADPGMGGVAFGAGLAVTSGALSVIVSNTILAANDAGGNADDCSGALVSDGHLLLGSNGGCAIHSSGSGDLVGDVAGGDDPIDPALAPLADNGGLTRTHALIEGSPAIDAGNPNPVMAGMPPVCEPEDQRGEPRPADGDGDGGAVCDIGAFEGVVAAAGGTGGNGGGGAIGWLLLALAAFGAGTTLAGGRSARCPHVCLIFAVFALLVPAVAPAATITIETTDDALDDADGFCSLREAVINANADDQSGSAECAAGSGADEIVFDSSLGTGIFLLNLGGPGENDAMEGDLDIHDDLRIVGNGGIDPDYPDGSAYLGKTIILMSALVGDRVIDVTEPGVTLVLEQLAIGGGRDVDEGGGIDGGSGTAKSLTLRNALITDNEAGTRGGGIRWSGELIIENSAVFNNDVTATGIGSAWGGGVYSTGSLEVLESAVFGNEAVAETSSARGGGLYIGGTDSAAIAGSLIAGNEARTTGTDAGLAGAGGAWVTAAADVERSAIVDNRAEGMDGDSWAMGGGLLAYEPVTITNSTIAGNSAISDAGLAGRGGIGSNDSETVLTLNNVTLTTNSAASGDAPRGSAGGIDQSAGSVTLRNTIVAGNTDSSGDHPDCRTSDSIASDDYNLLSDNTGCNFIAASNDQVGDVAGGGAPIDPADVLDIAGPADNGGGFMVGDAFIPQFTVALAADSLAVDAADPNVPGEGGTCETVDQRGGQRPADGDDDGSAVCDIGAFELNASFGISGPGGSSGGGGGTIAPPLLFLLAWLGLVRLLVTDRIQACWVALRDASTTVAEAVRSAPDSEIRNRSGAQR